MRNIDRLRQAYESLNKKHTFVPGQIVRWKPGLKNRRFPAYDEVVIIIEVLETPIIDKSDEVGSQYFHEPNDIVIGTFIKENEFFCFHCDSRRFEPATF